MSSQITKYILSLRSESTECLRARLAIFLPRKGRKTSLPARTTKKQCVGTVFLNVVRPPGLEPGTQGLKVLCSTN